MKLIFLFLLIACGKEQDNFSFDHKLDEDLLYPFEKARYSLDLKKFNELFSLTPHINASFELVNKDSSHSFSVTKDFNPHQITPYYYQLGCIEKDDFIDIKLKELYTKFDHLKLEVKFQFETHFLIPSSLFEDIKVNLLLEDENKNKILLHSEVLKNLNLIDTKKTIGQRQAFTFQESTCLSLEIESFNLKTPDRDIFYHKNMNLKKSHKEPIIQNNLPLLSTELETQIEFNVDNFLPNEEVILKGEFKGTPLYQDEIFIIPVACKPIHFGSQPKSNCTCEGRRNYDVKEIELDELDIQIIDEMNNKYFADYTYKNYREFIIKHKNNFYPRLSFVSDQKISVIENINFKPRVGNAICPKAYVQEVALSLEFYFTGTMERIKTLQ